MERKENERRVCLLVIILILTSVMFISCTGSSDDEEKKAVKDVFAMDTYMTFTAYGENAQCAVDMASDRIEELDAMLSAGSSKSEISLLNTNACAKLSDDTLEIIEKAIEVNKNTDGAFNPLIYPVMKCWGFDTGDYRIPLQNELNECLTHMDIDKIIVDKERKSVRFADPDMQIDLGGIAKGYASDQIMEIYRKNGVKSGIVSLGGNVQAIGSRPDGSSWKVAIRCPDGSSEYAGVLEVNDEAVVTSGGYERYFEQNGNTYHHIIEPHTGRPSDSGLASVTIVAKKGIVADALSTAIYIMGYEKAVKLWKEQKLSFEMFLIKDDGSQCITEGLAGAYKSDTDYSIIE